MTEGLICLTSTFAKQIYSLTVPFILLNQTRNLRKPGLSFIFLELCTGRATFKVSQLEDDESFLTRDQLCEFVSSSVTSTTGSGRMAQQEWGSIFQIKASKLQQGHSWRLEFDENIEPDSSNPGWKQYIRNTCARLVCWICINHCCWCVNAV